MAAASVAANDLATLMRSIIAISLQEAAMNWVCRRAAAILGNINQKIAKGKSVSAGNARRCGEQQRSSFLPCACFCEHKVSAQAVLIGRWGGLSAELLASPVGASALCRNSGITSGSRSSSSPLLEALPAKNWSALCRLEGDGGFFAAARAVGPRLHSGPRSRRNRSQRRSAFALADLTTFGFVLELLIVEEQLFSGCENEVSAAINTLQNLILEFHGELLPSARDPKPWTRVSCNSEGDRTERPTRQSQIPMLRYISLGSAGHARPRLLLLRLRARPDERSHQELGKLRAAIQTGGPP